MGLKTIYSNIKFFIFQLICILAKMVITFELVGIFFMQFSMLYSGEQILSFKPCLLFYAGDSLILFTDFPILRSDIISNHADARKVISRSKLLSPCAMPILIMDYSTKHRCIQSALLSLRKINRRWRERYKVNSYSSKFVPKSIRTHFGQLVLSFRSIRTHLVLIWSIRSQLVNSYSFWSIRAHIKF